MEVENKQNQIHQKRLLGALLLRGRARACRFVSAWAGAKPISAERCWHLARCAETGVSLLLLPEMEIASRL